MLRCLRQPCVPERDTLPFEFEPARIEFVNRSGGRGALRAPLPVLTVHTRVRPTDLATAAPWRLDVTNVPEPSYRLSPGLLLALLIGAASSCWRAAARSPTWAGRGGASSRSRSRSPSPSQAAADAARAGARAARGRGAGNGGRPAPLARARRRGARRARGGGRPARSPGRRRRRGRTRRSASRLASGRPSTRSCASSRRRLRERSGAAAEEARARTE